MSREEVRLITRAGVEHVGPARFWTERTVFVDGSAPFEFGEVVELQGEGYKGWARVAFVAEAPPGVVLSFEGGRIPRHAGWDDLIAEEDVTGSHDAEEAAILAHMVDRANTAAQDAAGPFASEDPTNRGSKAIDPESTVDAEAGLLQSVPAPAGGMTRLRATTEVTDLKDQGRSED